MNNRRLSAFCFGFALLTASASAQPAAVESAADVLKSLGEGTRHVDGRESAKLLIPQAGVRAAGPQEVYAYLQSRGDDLKWSPDQTELQLIGVRESLLGKHYTYRQVLDGLPVEGAEILVSVAHGTGEIYQVYNNAYPVTAAPTTAKLSLDKEAALDVAWADLRVHGKVLADLSAELVYLPVGGGFRLAYKTMVPVEAPFGYWEHYIDAETGGVIKARDTVISETKDGRVPDFASYTGPVLSRAQAMQDWGATKAQRTQAAAVFGITTVNGTALVFDPDPRTFLANEALADSSPASAFDAAYVTRTLRDITLNDGAYVLDGPYVAIRDFELPITAPSTTSDGNWTARRGNNAFNDVMSYFHIDQNQRYVQSLGYSGNRSIQAVPIEVDSNGLGSQVNAHYIPSTNQIAFGHAGVDLNEDADVILHEYGHALTRGINPNFINGDSGAIGEGFGDYWGASYSATTTNGATFHPEWAMSWVGHGSTGLVGRFLDRVSLTYDPSQGYSAHQVINGVADYGDQLWSTPLFQAFLALRAQGRPREEMDRIVLESLFGVGPFVSMREMAIATVSAAARLYPDGPHAGVYRAKFRTQNILPSGNEPTLLAHRSAPGVVELSWEKDLAGNNVMVAWNTSNTFGTPSGTYAAGSAITGGGTVLYVGPASGFVHNTTEIVRPLYYKAWSVLAGPSYSTGVYDIAAPGNDNFRDRALISGTSATIDAGNIMACSEVGEPTPGDATRGGRTIWWRWVSPGTGSVTLTTLGSTSTTGGLFDTMLGVYTGSSLRALSLVVGNDDAVPGSVLTSQVTFAVTPGVEYQIVVDGYRSSSDTAYGLVKLNLTSDLVLATPPTIATQPLNRHVGAHGHATFAVVASGTGPFQYAWQTQPAGGTSWTDLADTATYAGTQTALLTVNAVTNALSGTRYRCVVSNASGQTTSDAATLTVGITSTRGSDLDGDAAVDVLWRCTGTQEVGSWASGGSYVRVGTEAGSYVVIGFGDFDADGRSEAVWRHSATGALITWPSGGGTLPLGTEGSTWQVLSQGDFDGDGKTEFLWRHAVTGEIGVWPMAGGYIHLGNESTGWQVIGVGDVDGDRKMEPIWRHASTAEVGAWTMAGPYVRLGAESGAWDVIGFGDFDGDGKTEAMWRDRSTLEVMTWTMAGGSYRLGNEGTGWTIIGAGDYDADGRTEPLWRNTSSLEVGTWTMAGAFLHLGSESTGWVVIPQIPAITSHPSARWLRAGASTSFSVTVTANPRPLLQWQVSADGSSWADVVDGGEYSGAGTTTLTVTGATRALNGNRYRCVVRNAAGRAVSQAAQLGVAARGCVAGDLDGNGRTDPVWRNSGTLEMRYTSQTNGNVRVGTEGALTVVGVGDFDGDGQMEAMWRHSGSHQIVTWPTSGGYQVLGTEGAWTVIRVGDFDGDGKAEPMWRYTATGEVGTWTSGGAYVSFGTETGGWTVIGIADFDGDGRQEPAWRNTGTLEIRTTTAAGATVRLGTEGGGMTVIGFGDVDGDGKAEAFWRHATTLENITWPAAGGVIRLGSESGGWHVIDVGDYDGDGKTEPLWRHDTSHEIATWTMASTYLLIGTESGGWSVRVF